jgi:hypothetical protein
MVVFCILLRILANTIRDFRPRNTLCTLNTTQYYIVLDKNASYISGKKWNVFSLTLSLSLSWL